MIPDYERVSTTFWLDFTIAEHFGEKAIIDTYNRAFNEWKGQYKYLTELVMVLNYKIWQHWNESQDSGFARLYDRLWREADDYAYKHLEGDELRFYFEITD